jgi:hypothetical protein
LDSCGNAPCLGSAKPFSAGSIVGQYHLIPIRRTCSTPGCARPETKDGARAEHRALVEAKAAYWTAAAAARVAVEERDRVKENAAKLARAADEARAAYFEACGALGIDP